MFLIPFLTRALEFARTSMQTTVSANVEPDPRLAAVVQASIVAAESFTVFQSAFENTPSHLLLGSSRSSNLPEITVGRCALLD